MARPYVLLGSLGHRLGSLGAFGIPQPKAHMLLESHPEITYRTHIDKARPMT